MGSYLCAFLYLVHPIISASILLGWLPATGALKAHHNVKSSCQSHWGYLTQKHSVWREGGGSLFCIRLTAPTIISDTPVTGMVRAGLAQPEKLTWTLLKISTTSTSSSSSWWRSRRRQLPSSGLLVLCCTGPRSDPDRGHQNPSFCWYCTWLVLVLYLYLCLYHRFLLFHMWFLSVVCVEFDLYLYLQRRDRGKIQVISPHHLPLSHPASCLPWCLSAPFNATIKKPGNALRKLFQTGWTEDVTTSFHTFSHTIMHSSFKLD